LEEFPEVFTACAVTELESSAGGYFLLDEVFVGKWLPHDDGSVSDPVFQVVVPAKFREVVLETAHD